MFSARLVLLVFALAALPVRAEPVDRLRVAAASGDPAAQAELGDAFAQGRGVPRNFEHAFAWYLKAARAGHSAAYLPVASAYHDGRGVPRDMARAMFWFERAAAAGNAVAANELAFHRAEDGGDLGAAQALVEQALAREPENAHYLDTKAYILKRRGRRAEALELLRRAHTAAPADAEIAAHLREAEHHHH